MSSGLVLLSNQLSMNAKPARWMISLIAWLYLAGGAVVSTSIAAEKVEQDRFEKEVVASGCKDAVGMDISADGRLVFIERTGAVKLVKLREQQVTQLAKIPAAYIGEVGLVGVAVDKSFSQNGWIYLSYCPESSHSTMRLSRFTTAGGKIDLASEKKLFDYPIDESASFHMGGGLVMDKHGDLYMGTGDNSPPIAELPVDQRPGREFYDSLRSSANSNDLRGKILRVHPRPEGGYDIPAGNLFADGKDGRPEIYCMGCRNPFRLAVDDKTGWLYWGDVGPNILDPSLKIGPDGYDEVNQTRAAGNFGWPMFVGPNEAYRNFDFATRKTGELFDIDQPVNASRNNTGAKLLPRPQPAWIWYPSIESKTFPELGSGGRSAMAGPTYHYDSKVKRLFALPASYDGVVFIYDWMRNWINTVRLDKHGQPERMEPFLPHMAFRKPIDLKLGLDGCLYVIDYGNIWAGNTDGQILRIVYRRGNRSPFAVAKATPEAGKQPLEVHLSGRESSDKDVGDQLSFAWRMGPDKPVFSHEAETAVTFDRPGTYPVELTVSDSNGATSTTTIDIRVGNARPKVTILEPRQGGFFDWGDRVRYRVELADEEDGSSKKNPEIGARIRVQGQYFVQRPGSASDQEGLLEPGLALMRQTTCFSCHSVQATTGGGPPYSDVSSKYHDQPDAREQLAKKIVSGGAGVWGPKPMPPHPQNTLEQARQMADWVLSLSSEGMGSMVAGSDGVIQLPAAPPAGRDAGVYVLSASYADQGAEGAPSLTGEGTIVLHSRRKLAVAFERRHSVKLVEVFVVGPAGRFSNGGWIAFDDVDLHGIDHVDCNVAQAGNSDAVLELHAGAPDGTLLGKCAVPPSKGSELVLPATIPLHQSSKGSCTLFVVARANKSTDGKIATLREMRFIDSSLVGDERRHKQKELAKLPLSPPAAITARAVVKVWTVDDLKPVFDRSSTGRSIEHGKILFASASCCACHRLGKEGGTIGPDLPQSLARLNREPNPRDGILREIVRPSDVVEPKYRTNTLITSDGRTLSGLVVRQDERAIWLVMNPQMPNEVKKVSRSDIEQIVESPNSLMPEGLLNTFDAEEIADLLAYIRSAIDPQHAALH